MVEVRPIRCLFISLKHSFGYWVRFCIDKDLSLTKRFFFIDYCAFPSIQSAIFSVQLSNTDFIDSLWMNFIFISASLKFLLDITCNCVKAMPVISLFWQYPGFFSRSIWPDLDIWSRFSRFSHSFCWCLLRIECSSMIVLWVCYQAMKLLISKHWVINFWCYGIRSKWLQFWFWGVMKLLKSIWTVFRARLFWFPRSPSLDYNLVRGCRNRCRQES